ncbi:hypothetical protein P153DRAFT_333241 [Dothidotthia symphoricarpi CBS 119687]|uniref:Uncharacterized protein n=1 Tax=Dothidotthia symphoricarpi CBS 119687 TaxID=1392245 RepID=A0A6A6ANT9_9PLEO|nr:uncharacterized protein P153DRAFT_333241 [Dothidotthia symphoricarpi CBS 119687]KAF2132715.1 hypothetical protein P153DRAFT_333241 [Dothidotthia symphoricarpi CBS 119687]
MTDEILVHISTPATKQNDDLYQSLADAYKEFEPYRRHPDDVCLDEPRQANEVQVPHNVSVLNTTSTTPKGSSNDADANTSIFSTSKDSYGSFPSYPSPGDQERLDNQLYYDDDGSVPVSSRLARLDHIHVTWRKQTTPKSSFVGRQRPAPRDEDEDEADTAFIEDSQLAAQALQSQLQDGYSTTDEDTEEDEVDIDEGVEKDESDVESGRNNLSSSAVEPTPSTHSAVTRSVSASHKESRLLDNTLDLSLSIVRDAENNRISLTKSDIALHPPDFTKLPLDAFPPAPEVSIAQPGTLPSQITEYLAAIKIQYSARFKPSKKLRTLESDERGYWSVGCTTWSQNIQHEFWTRLCEYVQSGKLGWGTTLHRDLGSSRTIGRVKMYCWGEVVEHLWLLLWVCSKGRVSGSGSKWVDADGITIVEGS